MNFLQNVILRGVKNLSNWAGVFCRACFGFFKLASLFIYRYRPRFFVGKSRSVLVVVDSFSQANSFFALAFSSRVDLSKLESAGFCWVEVEGLRWCVAICQPGSLLLLGNELSKKPFSHSVYLAEYKSFYDKAKFDEVVEAFQDLLIENKQKIQGCQWHIYCLGLEEAPGFDVMQERLISRELREAFFFTRFDSKTSSDVQSRQIEGLAKDLRVFALGVNGVKQEENSRLLFSFCCVYTEMLKKMNEFSDFFMKSEAPIFIRSIGFFCAGDDGFFIRKGSKITNNVFGDGKVGFLKKINTRLSVVAFVCGVLSLSWLFFLDNEKNKSLVFQKSILQSDREVADILAYSGDGLIDYHQQLVDIYMAYLSGKSNAGFLFGRNYFVGQGDQIFLNDLLRTVNYFVQSEIVSYLEERLSFYHNQWKGFPENREKIRGEYYHYFKYYMMLWLPDHACLDGLSDFFSNIWLRSVAGSNGNSSGFLEGKKNAKSMMKFYLLYFFSSKESSDISLSRITKVEENIINQSRKDLLLNSNAINEFYEKMSFMKDGYSVPDILKKEASYINYSSAKIPYVYTMEGWQDYVDPWLRQAGEHAGHDSWVFGDDGRKVVDSIDVKNMIAIYQKSYAENWLAAAKSISFKPLLNINNALNILTKATSADSDYFQMLSYFHHIFRRQLNINNPTLFHGSSDGFSQFINKYRQQLLMLLQDLQQMQSGVDQEKSEYEYCNKVFSGVSEASVVKIVAMINAFSSGQPEPVQKAYQHLLLMPVVSVWKLILQDSALYVDGRWKALIYQPYLQDLNGVFPADLSATNDVPLSTMALWFSNNSGYLYSFYQHYLYQITDNSGGVLALKSWLGFSVPVNAESLSRFSYLLSFSKNLFSSKSLGFLYRIDPDPSDDIESIVFYDGLNKFNYNNGFLKGYDFKYLSGDLKDSYVSVKAIHDELSHYRSTGGLYSFLKLLREADWRKTAKNNYQLCWHFNHDQHCLARVYLSGNAISTLFTWHKDGLVFPTSLVGHISG